MAPAQQLRANLLDLEADGAVLLAGCELGVSREGRLESLRAGARPEGEPLAREGDPAIEVWIPGLVNVHAHLELTAFEGRIEPTPSFRTWGGHVFRMKGEGGAELLREGARLGIERTVAAGVTAIGDIVTAAAAPEAVAASPLRGVTWAEVICITPAMLETRLDGLRRLHREVAEIAGRTDGRLRAGVSPHAPHTVAPEAMRAVAGWMPPGAPVTIHVAETTAEIDFLLRGEGEFRAMFEGIVQPDGKPLIDARWQPPGRGPVACCDFPSLLPARGATYREASLRERVERRADACAPMTILGHGNYLTRDEVRLLAGRRAAVCWCPETHTFFSHTPWPQAQNRTLPVCIGTDSLASAWSLDPLDQVAHAIDKVREAGDGAGRGAGGDGAAWPVADMLQAVTLRARDCLLGREAGPPDADFTILEFSGPLRAFLEGAQPAAAGRILLPDATLQALFGRLGKPFRRTTGMVIGGTRHTTSP